MTAVASAPRPKPPARPLTRGAVMCWLVLVAALAALAPLASAPVSAQTTDEPAIGFDWTVSPLGPGSGFTIDGTVTIDPDSAPIENGEGVITWSLTVGLISDVAIDSADCGETLGTTCEADVDSGNETITFSGVVEDDAADEVTADVEITGAMSDRLDRDTILFKADTCGTVAVVTGTPAPGRLPTGPATPGAVCAGVAGTIEATVVPVTAVPTEPPTEAPTQEPTEGPTIAPTPTGEPTVAPTELPTQQPTPTEEPTATVMPSDVPTEAPTAEPTATPTATMEPTEAATAEPTLAPTATTMPTPTSGPTDVPTAATEPTIAPTDVPTEAPTEEPAPTIEPTREPVADPTAPPIEEPQPTLEVDDGSDNTGLWIGGGSLLVLAAAAGIVLYQRRKLSA